MGDQKLRKRIGWLNKQGGFDNGLLYDKVLEAVEYTGVDTSEVMSVLKELEDKKSEVRDPTAYVTSALRKAGKGGGGGRGGGGGGQGGQKRSRADDALAPQSKRQRGPAGYDDFDRKLRKRVGWLNQDGGFGNNLKYDAIVDAAQGVDLVSIMRILKNLEEKGASIKEPTSWVTSALRKEAQGNSSASAQSSAQDYDFDAKLRRKIGWLNKQGWYESALNYDKVSEAADGLEESKIMKILNNLEDKGGDVREPTSWVTAALRKEGGGHGGSWAPPAGGGGRANGHTNNYSSPEDMDQRLRRRIGWLNNKGGFDNGIQYDKVADAAVGLDEDTVMGILKNLEEKGVEGVKDPTAWVTSAIRKEGGRQTVVPWGGSGQAVNNTGLDQKLRKRITWLNNAGGFENRIRYDQVVEEAMSVDEAVVFKVLKNLEEKGTSVNEPTSWVIAGLRKEGGESPAWLLKLGKRIRWLNNNGFDNAIKFDDVADAAGNGDNVFEILKKLENNEGGKTIDNPTGWVVNALKKQGRGGGAPSKGIQKKSTTSTIKPMFQKKK